MVDRRLAVHVDSTTGAGEMVTSATAGNPPKQQHGEYQAIVMAVGQGSRIHPLATPATTSTSTTPSLPKCLLPIGNRPVLKFALDLLDSNRFDECIVVCRKGHHQQLDAYIQTLHAEEPAGGATTDSSCQLSIKLIAVDDDVSGTADALREIAAAGHIHTHFFLLPGDLICNIQLQHLADIQRIHNSSVVVTVTKPYEAKTPIPSAAVSAKKSKSGAAASVTADHDEADAVYLGIDYQRADRLLLYRAAADLEETLDVNKSLLRRHPNITLHTKLRDQHVYLFSYWVSELLQDRSTIQSIQQDLIPYLVRSQYKSNMRAWQQAANKHLTAYKHAMTMSHTPQHHTTTENYRCHAYIPPSTSTITIRACNTLRNYSIANFDLAVDPQFVFTPWQPLSASPYNFTEATRRANPSAKLDPKCIVGHHTTVGEHSILKRCIIGKNCTIGSGCKLTNTIIMDNVTIADHTKIDDSIIASSVTIQSGSTLKDVRIGVGYTVEQKSDIKNESLSVADDDEGELL